MFVSEPCVYLSLYEFSSIKSELEGEKWCLAWVYWDWIWQGTYQV